MTTVLPAPRTAPDLLHTPVMYAPPPVIVDGVWQIDQNNVPHGQPWKLTHLPTTWSKNFGTRVELQMWVDRPEQERRKDLMAAIIRGVHTFADRLDALPADTRQRTIESLKRQRAAWTRMLDILDGATIPVIPSAAIVMDDLTDVEYRCHCGGYLITIGQELKHVDACEYCYDGNEACDKPGRHVMCMWPGPVQCDHQCKSVADAWVKCSHGKEHSCGNHGC